MYKLINDNCTNPGDQQCNLDRIQIEKYLDVTMKFKNEVDSPSCQSIESRLLRLAESI